ncbi:MAG: 2Fe-2S ferredoxin [Acidobacteria bacterium]|nr:MAG: 2Fe-2S ferredoxin [Acidobacteriota bacterium]REK10629.1 MAG: 2Fe-2S ferredoxin [Acidobacteriota bacterium]
MPKITFITSDGAEHEVEAQVGQSVMEAAIDHGVPGIDADCGGCCSCATCHVFVDEKWRAEVGEPVDMEADMLEVHDDRRPGSRLSCQIPVRDELDGLVVRVPEFQM